MGFRNQIKKGASPLPTPLSLDNPGDYLCPICRHDHITPMALMDAFACDFCRHIFEANLSQQTVHVVDSAQPMAWRWTGQRWRPLHHSNQDVTFILWVSGLMLAFVPAGLVATSAYIFPPLEGSPGSSWPAIWACSTLISHALIVGWLMMEHYQVPIYVAAKVWLRRFIEQHTG